MQDKTDELPAIPGMSGSGKSMRRSLIGGKAAEAGCSVKGVRSPDDLGTFFDGLRYPAGYRFCCFIRKNGSEAAATAFSRPVNDQRPYVLMTFSAASRLLIR